MNTLTDVPSELHHDNLRTFHLFMCTVLAYLFVSSAAHLMHSASKTLHYLAFYCDFATIASYSFLSAVTFFVYSSTHTFYFTHRRIYIPVACCLALAISYGQFVSHILSFSLEW